MPHTTLRSQYGLPTRLAKPAYHFSEAHALQRDPLEDRLHRGGLRQFDEIPGWGLVELSSDIAVAVRRP